MNDAIVSENVRRYKWIGTRPVRPDGVPKVTGRALYGADMKMPGMLVGRVLRSPHAHARIRSIDVTKAAALPGVKAVVTSADFPDHKFEYIGPERVAVNFWHVTRNIMAREKVLYEGHAVAAVAAISDSVAAVALDLIKVDYEVLPHVIDVDEAMADGAPLLFEDMIPRGIEGAGPSNISKRLEFKIGDVDAGFAQADVVVEDTFKTAAVHQAYIEPHACVAKFEADGQGEIWCSSQGHFTVRALTAKLLGIPVGDLRVYPAEIGGGFGGKTVVYLEPVAAMLSKKCGLPIRLQMSREEVFKSSGPTSGSSMRVKIGATKDGRLVAADGEFRFQAGAFPGLAGDEWVPMRLRAVRHPEPAQCWIRCHQQPSESGSVSRSRLAHLGLCRGERARRDRAQVEHGSAGVAVEECLPHRHAYRGRAEARACGLRRDGRSAAEAPRLQDQTGQEPRARRRIGLLVQRWRRVRVPRCRSMPTGRCWWRRAARMSAAPARRWR